MRRRYRNLSTRNLVAVIAAGSFLAASCSTDDASDASATTTNAPTPTSAVSAPDTAPETSAVATPTSAPDPVNEGGGPRPVIVATTTIWGDVVSNLVCHEFAEVVTIIPAGADSHAFEPSLQDRGTMGGGADLLVVNGLDLEEGLLPTIEAVAGEGVPMFTVTDGMEGLLDFDLDDDFDDIGRDADHGHDDDDFDDDDHGHDDGDHQDDGEDDHRHDVDPHVWFDPVRVAAVLPALGEAIISATGLDHEDIDACVDAYQSELLSVHDELETAFGLIPEPQRTLVTNHDSLGYLADRYGFTVIGTVIPGTSSMAETNPADLEELAQLVRTAGVPAVFAQVETSDAELQALAARLGGIKVVSLFTESLGSEDSGTATYIGFLRTNAALITDALADGGS